MHNFLVERGNLMASAQYLIDTKRVLADWDLETVQELIKTRLREIYSPHQSTGISVRDAVSVWGSLYCLPYQSSELEETDIVLNLFFKEPPRVSSTGDFLAL